MADEIVPPVKPGFKTTEFWLSVGVGVLGLLGQVAGAIPEPWGGIMTTFVTFGYAISRGLAKQ